ncbi:MAG: hypothetical protein FWB86_04325 [Treponema sp.]|nr:hypothetical protein [Treponema sp.]MCL2250302.1 hypothetical protein [Treponema sp.]
MNDGYQPETDESAVKRPNAKYKLSNPDNTAKTEDGLVFYYNRERRLENAPEAVKTFYKNQNTNSNFNLFGPLLADKPRKMLFFSIIFLCAVILILSFFDFFNNDFILDKNKIEITAAAYEESTIVVLKKNRKKDDAYSGAVDIAVTPFLQPKFPEQEDQLPVFTHRIFFTLENEEVYRFAVPFASDEMIMLLQNEINSLQLKFKPK